MAFKIPQYIYKRLVIVINNLRNAIRQEVIKAFLVSLINVEPIMLELETTIEDSS